MRKIMLDVATTLDGYIEGPNGELDWLVKDAKTDFGDILSSILAEVDVIFYGRISYEKWGNYQPDENGGPKLKDAYRLLHSKTKYVFSTTMNDDGKATFIHSNIEKRIAEIKEQPGKNIWLYGGSKLTTTLVNLGVVDIYRLAVHPVILGSGTPLFKDIRETIKLKLVEAAPSPSGIVLLSYEADHVA